MKSETTEARSWDTTTVRECARRALDCQYRSQYRGDDASNAKIAVACGNQALFAYHAIMKMIDPTRSLVDSCAEVKDILK